MISMNKQYQTRDGRKIRLLCVDGPGTYSVVGADDTEVYIWTEYGEYQAEGRPGIVKNSPFQAVTH